MSSNIANDKRITRIQQFLSHVTNKGQKIKRSGHDKVAGYFALSNLFQFKCFDETAHGRNSITNGGSIKT